MRTITVYATRGGVQTIDTEATTWGELKPIVEEHYDLENLIATEGINKTTLEHKDAKLPDSDFTLFLRPSKFKAGATDFDELSFKELREMLTDEDKKRLAEEYNENWTRLSRNIITEYLKDKEESEDKEDSISVKLIVMRIPNQSNEKDFNIKEIDDIESFENFINSLINEFEDYIDDKDSKSQELADEYQNLIDGFDD